MKRLLPLFLLAALSACGHQDDNSGGVTASEQRALDDAAEMVEAQKLDPSAIPPAPESSAPAPASQSN